MTKEEFEADQMRRKGYICPANEFNPDYHGEPAAVICPKCAHYKKDCIVYGNKNWRLIK